MLKYVVGFLLEKNVTILENDPKCSTYSEWKENNKVYNLAGPFELVNRYCSNYNAQYERQLDRAKWIHIRTNKDIKKDEEILVWSQDVDSEASAGKEQVTDVPWNSVTQK